MLHWYLKDNLGIHRLTNAWKYNLCSRDNKVIFPFIYNWGQYGYNMAIPGHISINA